MNKKKVPIRKCVGCGESKPKKDMIRVVRSKDGEIFMDSSGKASGRGAYVCYNQQCMEKVRKRNKLNQAFSTSVSPEVTHELEKKVMEKDKNNKDHKN